MGRTQINAGAIQKSLWLAGFSLDDFTIPSEKTHVAVVAEQVTRVVMDLALNEDLYYEDQDEAPVHSTSVYEEVLKGWGEGVETEWTNRKSVWPVFDTAKFIPDARDERRIRDNIAAIKLLKDIQAQGRVVCEEDRNVLLKYCGWGGLARVFSPDGSQPHVWAAYRDELKGLVTEQEFTALQASITTAYFTDPGVVRSMWRIVERLGFKGGRVLEPSGGAGHFLAGMPVAIANRSDISAVEIDTVSAAMMEVVFGSLGVQVYPSALETARLPSAFFDLVIGNVPFGDFRSLDTSTAAYADWSIHNYFLGKSMDLVRPGGLIVLVTSRHSMDSKSDGHRKWLAAHAELLGAYRLPTMAFKGQANTEAVTDILVFQRRQFPDYSKEGWVTLGKASEEMLVPGQSKYLQTRHHSYQMPRDTAINSYYARHPKGVIGLLQWQSGQFGESLNPVFSGDVHALESTLTERMEDLPQGVYKEPTVANDGPKSSMERYGVNGFVQPGSLVLHNGRICVSEGTELLDLDSIYAGTARKRVLGMIELKKCAQRVIECQATSQDDFQLKVHQRALNVTYDNFVANCGYLSTVANSRVMRSDPDWPVLLALEIWNDEDGTAAKADIFSKRTVGHCTIPERVDSVKDAMLISLGLYGKIVLKDMALRTGLPAMQVVNELSAQALAYRDPVLARWVPADEYLSGNIREKIAAVKAAGPSYHGNMPALEAVLPADLGPADVEARLGAPWIPVDFIATFAKELVNDTNNSITVSYEAASASWSIKANCYRVEYVGDRILQTSKWGTNRRWALELLEAALNQSPPTITVEVDGRRVVDKIATLNVRDKWQGIRDHFRSWVYQDTARRDALLRIYNDLFNQVVVRKFDGSHLQLPGMSCARVPYGHQKNGIWRIVTTGNTLLAHTVGAGKTLLMVAASMELRRLGRASKPLHVVQNSCLEQYAAEFLQLYPQARVLIASKDDLHGDKRRTFVARIATGDWDAIVMTQSTFERLMMSPDKQQTFIDAILAEARTAARLAEDRGAKRSLKEIEKRIKECEARVKRLVETEKKDEECVWFDELGVDFAFIDEAHAYKNLARITKMPRIAGLSNAASQRAFDVFMKTRYLMGLRGDTEDGVVMATATPLSNSLAELHTFQVYLQPKTLKRLGLYEFDAWSASFGESVTGVELSPDGSGYRMNTRYCRFVNLPELMSIFRGVADIKTKQMLKLPTPNIVGGKPQTMVAKPSEALLTMVQGLVERAELIRGGAVKPEEDNMLKITNDGRKAALDVRLVDPSLPFDPACKLAVAVENMLRIYQEGSATRVTQLVFSDLGTPGNRFNVYDEVKRLLIEGGVPDNEIAFIQEHDSDTARAKLFKRVREGLVRFVLGSTPKLGTGTNVQRLLKAIHQLDAPWRPSDVEQRDGRGDRQGNLNDSIELWRYVTEKSFDAYTWNLLDVKARFIEQVMTAESGLRTVEDVSMSALTYAEIKAIASGNPLVLEKTAVDAEVQKLCLKRTIWEEDRWRMGHREADLLRRIQWIDRSLANIELDAKLAEAVTGITSFVPVTTIAKKAMQVVTHARDCIGAAFRAHSVAQDLSDRPKVIGMLGPFEVIGTKTWNQSELYVQGPNSRELVRVNRPMMNDLAGVGDAVRSEIVDLVKWPAQLRQEYGSKVNELATTRDLLLQEFDGSEKLSSLLVRQREIEVLLDLDKDAEGSQSIEAEVATT